MKHALALLRLAGRHMNQNLRKVKESDMGHFRRYMSADRVKASVTGQGDTCGHEATTDTTIGIISENL